jgi:hypothetical protein
MMQGALTHPTTQTRTPPLQDALKEAMPEDDWNNIVWEPLVEEVSEEDTTALAPRRASSAPRRPVSPPREAAASPSRQTAAAQRANWQSVTDQLCNFQRTLCIRNKPPLVLKSSWEFPQVVPTVTLMPKAIQVR